jgi:hypothetical protein
MIRLFLVALCLFPMAAFAEDAAVPGWIDGLAAFLKPQLEALAAQYPVVSAGLFIIGVARLVLKPLLSIVRTIVEATPSAADNAVLDSVEKSLPMKIALYILDWLFSVKLPPRG